MSNVPTDSVVVKGLDDEMLQAHARRLAEESELSQRGLAEELGVAASSLHEALHGEPTARLRKLRMRVLEALSPVECSAQTVITVSHD